MANNVTREEHLEALASAIKTYTDSRLANVGGSSYTLPTASATEKGGIIVGAGLSMAGDTLSVTLDSGETYSEATTLTAGLMSATDKAKLDNIANNANDYTLPTASTTTKGGVKIGNGLEMQGDTLSVTLQGGETYDTFTGATGLASGASGLVPAPAAGDNEKFLRGDGQWATVSGGGQSYSIATTTQAGLMSAEDKQHLDAVFQDSADLTDAVITVVGGKFLPSVDSVSDFNTYKDSNLPFLDNKLQRILDGSSMKTYKSSGNSYNFNLVRFQYDNAEACIDEANNGKYSLAGAENACSLNSYAASIEPYFEMYKMSESAGFIIRTAEITRSGYQYSGAQWVRGFNVSESRRVSLSGTTHTIAAAASSVASANAYTGDCTIIPAAPDPSNLLFVTARHSNDNTTYTYSDAYIDVYTGNLVTIKAETTIGTDYSYNGTAGKTNIDILTYDFNKPLVTFADGKVTVSRKDVHSLPFIYYQKSIYNSADETTGGGDYVLFCRGNNRGTPQTLQLTTISGGETSMLCPWFEDNDNYIAGLWASKSSADWYVITFKQGTYDYSADWYDKCSTVWGIDFLTPSFIKLTKKLSAVINDLVL